jgi:hypothetical protein
MALSGPERNLAQIAAATRHDPALARLADLAADGARYMVGLLVNGMTVYGRVASPRAIYELLDADTEPMIEGIRADHPARGAWIRRYDADVAGKAELEHRNKDVDVDDMSEDDARATINNFAITITLAEVSVFPPGGQHFEVNIMSVARSHIAAWWLIPRGADGMATVNHPVR